MKKGVVKWWIKFERVKGNHVDESGKVRQRYPERGSFCIALSPLERSFSIGSVSACESHAMPAGVPVVPWPHLTHRRRRVPL